MISERLEDPQNYVAVNKWNTQKFTAVWNSHSRTIWQPNFLLAQRVQAQNLNGCIHAYTHTSDYKEFFFLNTI